MFLDVLNNVRDPTFLEGPAALFRVYPLVVITVSICLYLITPSIKTFEIVCAVTITHFSVDVFKTFAKLIMKNKTFPIIGTGLRQKGAKNCGYLKNDKMTTSYGMPSGHSMMATCFATSMTIYLQNKEDLTDNQKLYSCIVLWLITGSACLSRFVYGCHTLAQVIVGSLIGTGMAYLIHYLFIFYDSDSSESN